MYQILGRQTVDCITGSAPRISEEEMEQMYRRIDLLLEDRKQIEAEIEAFQSSLAARIKGER